MQKENIKNCISLLSELLSKYQDNTEESEIIRDAIINVISALSIEYK